MARLAGLRPEAAKTIATASQYVDDAVDADIQHHENGNKLAPIVTAHRLVELIENRDVNDQPFVWVPFALELIGLIAHVYADTFSHAGFSGVSSKNPTPYTDIGNKLTPEPLAPEP